MDVKNLFSLDGKKGFITGGAQGIGKTIAAAYAELGADLALVDMNIDKAIDSAEEIAKKTGRKVVAYKCDVKTLGYLPQTLPLILLRKHLSQLLK